MNKLYRSKLLWPSMRVKHEPYLKKLTAISKQHGSWELRWRWPWDKV